MQTFTPTISGFGGELTLPGDPGYDAARRVHNGMIDRRPAVIAKCTGPDDVVLALRHAREAGLEVAVRSGGHHVAGFGVRDGAVVIDTTGMKGVDVQPERRLARVGGGTHWCDVDSATQAFGLAVTGGRVTDTGVVGQALGSGSGWLERSLGLTCDNLVAAELVTADGDLVRASEHENPELLWGLCGAGANFGVVTSLELRLHPVGPIVLGGLAMFEGGREAELAAAWRDLNADAPDEFGSAFVLIGAPPDPALPPSLRGKRAVGLAVCHTGDLDEGRQLLERLYRTQRPAIDGIEPMPYTQVQSLLDDITGAGMRQYWKAENVAELTDASIEALTRHASAAPSPFTQVVLEPKGRAIARADASRTALGGRDADYTWYSFTCWLDAAEDDLQIGWTRALADEMQQYSIDGAAPNFYGAAGADRLRRNFGEAKYERLVALKRRYDPANVFAWNQNIDPS